MCSFPLIRSKMNIVNNSNRGSKGIQSCQVCKRKCFAVVFIL